MQRVDLSARFAQVVTKRAGVTNRRGSASNLTRFVTLVTILFAVVTIRATTGPLQVSLYMHQRSNAIFAVSITYRPTLLLNMNI